MLLSEICLYIWVISISCGVVFNTVGEKAILVLFIITFLVSGKLKISKKILVCVSLFGVLILIKSIGVKVNITDDYHGLWAQYVRIIELILMLPLANSISNNTILNRDRIIRNCKNLFNLFFYSTIIITIIMLSINGKGYYRKEELMLSPIYAPQSFLIYSIALAEILTSKILYEKNRRVVNILKLLVNGYFVFMMNYTTQMLFFLLSIFTAFFCKKSLNLRKNLNRKSIFLLSFLIIGVIVVPKLPETILYINKSFFSHNEDVSMRLSEIASFLKSGKLFGKALGTRIRVMLDSWKTFLAHPWFGVPFNNYNYDQISTIGGHHEWIDDLAKFGLLGCFLFMQMIYYGIKNLILIGGKKGKESLCLLKIFIIYGFFNPVINMTFVIVIVISRYAINDTCAYIDLSETR